jgi:hypothetical protein
MCGKLMIGAGVVAAVLSLTGRLTAGEFGVSPQGSTSNVLNESLNSIDETYRGKHQFFNDDMVGNLFSTLFGLIQVNLIEPFIQGVGEGNPLCLLGLGALVLVGMGFFHRMGGRCCDAMLGQPAPSKTETTKKA